VTSQDGATSVEIPVEAIAASLTFTPEDDGELAVAVDPAALQTAMGEDFTAFGTPPEDARFEVAGDSVRVVPSVDGTGVDPAALAGQLLDVLPDPAPRTVTAELGAVPADLTTAEAEALGIREEVSSFTTTTANNASGTNIRVVAEEVDGALVLPGETFSLNEYTGPRGTAQGYVPANVISGGELSTAVGGGISQFATTMFNAVFFGGLEDVYHKPHSFYISRYPAGREATVYEGQIDLQWRNDTDTGIYVDTQWSPGASGGSITVTFYGTKRYEVEAIEGPRRNVRTPAVQEKVDDGNCIPQGGAQGFDITVTRVFRDLQSGAEVRRETFETSYAAEAVIRCVAPPAEEPAPAASDADTPPAEPTA
jgi:vancomycin resistance protein YoaR